MSFYILILVIKLVTYGDDTTKTDIKQTTGEALGTVHLNETGYIPSFSLVNVTTLEAIIVDEEIKRYITLRAS